MQYKNSLFKPFMGLIAMAFTVYFCRLIILFENVVNITNINYNNKQYVYTVPVKSLET